MRGRFIAYFRVSTARQGRSGLGLEAQRAAVVAYLNGGSWELLEEFTEVESGKRNDRPQLAAALTACRIHKATLIIAKLDRLARNVAFVSKLMEAGVDFIAVDFPQANKLTLHILAAVAEHEAQMISERTKSALAAAKARGVVLGGFRGRTATDADRARGRAVRTASANAYAADIAETLRTIASEGPGTPSALARALNARGVPAPKGGVWAPVQIRRITSRVAAL